MGYFVYYVTDNAVQVNASVRLFYLALSYRCTSYNSVWIVTGSLHRFYFDPTRHVRIQNIIIYINMYIILKRRSGHCCIVVPCHNIITGPHFPFVSYDSIDADQTAKSSPERTYYRGAAVLHHRIASVPLRARYPDVNIISRRKRTRWRTRIGNNLPIIRVRGNGCTRVRRPKNNNINKYRAVSFERKQKRSPCPGRSCACTALLTLSSSWRALLTELKTFDSFKSMLKPLCSTILDSLTRGAGVHHRSKTTCTTYVLLLSWCSMKTVSPRRIILKSYT